MLPGAASWWRLSDLFIPKRSSFSGTEAEPLVDLGVSFLKVPTQNGGCKGTLKEKHKYPVCGYRQ